MVDLAYDTGLMSVDGDLRQKKLSSSRISGAERVAFYKEEDAPQSAATV